MTDSQVLEIMTMFYPNNAPTSGQINRAMGELATKMLREATEASSKMDYVPRPTGGLPGVGYVVKQAFGIFWRRHGASGLYDSVVKTVARNYRTEYEMIRQGVE